VVQEVAPENHTLLLLVLQDKVLLEEQVTEVVQVDLPVAVAARAEQVLQEQIQLEEVGMAALAQTLT
jgi:hypothetical protein